MKREDMEALKRQVRPWLEKVVIPLESYGKLPYYDKVMLHAHVRGLTCLSDLQLIELYKKLHPQTSREEGLTSDFNFITKEEIRKFFLPLTPSEKLHYLEKF